MTASPMSTPRRRRPPAGYVFTNDTHAFYWRPTPHWHINQDDYGDIDGRAWKDEAAAKREMWRLFLRDYDYEQIESYTHRPQDGSIEISYPEGHQPKQIVLGLLYCDTPDDCYMVEEQSEPRS